MNRTFLAIDLGTTTFKGAVLDLDSLGISHVHRLRAPAPVAGLPPTRHETDPGEVVSTVRRLLLELHRVAPDAAGLVLCSQMHSVLLTDDRGSPRSNVITWKDQRATEPARGGRGTPLDRLREVVTTGEVDDIGGELRPGVPITTLATMGQSGELADGLRAMALPDYILATLCGTEPTTDPTIAAASGLYHLERRDWHRDLLTRLGLKKLRWPRIRPFREPVGVATIAGKNLTCFGAVGDQQCALAGASVGERELSLNISTGSQISLVTRDRPYGEFLVRPYFDDRWLGTIVSVPAGRSLGLLVELLFEIGQCTAEPWGTIRAAVDRVKETDLEVDLSFFAGPTGDRGRIANIHEGNLSVGHLFVAAFRSMAANYARFARVLSLQKEWDRVVFSGGLAQRFPRLRGEALAALGNPPARLSTSEEETLHGLLALALVCDGREATVEAASATIGC